jgi:acetolactate synthase-1/3 small subunit
MKIAHTIIALVQDKPGVLNRIASMFRRRGFNISSLSVGHSEAPGISRMTIVVDGDDAILEQATKQLRKLIEVQNVFSPPEESLVARELALIKVVSTPSNRIEIIPIVNIFRGNVIDIGDNSLIVEVTGDEDKITSIIEILDKFGVEEIMRSGRLAMSRGDDIS